MEVEFRTPTEQDIRFLSANMSASDIAELDLIFGMTPEQGIRMSIANSSKYFICAAVVDGRVVCIFGAAYSLLLSDTAFCWLLSTMELRRYFKRLLKETRKIFNMMLEHWPILTNIVDARNKGTIAWLKMLGAEFNEPPFKIKGRDVFRFYLRRAV